MPTSQAARLNHMSFPSADVPATAAFFQRFFGCEIAAAGEHALLHRDGLDIVLESVADLPAWPKTFHIGFELPTLAAVQDLHRNFVDEGVPMETGVFNNSRGSRFFCRAPGGVMIEVNTREDKQADWQKLF